MLNEITFTSLTFDSLFQGISGDLGCYSNNRVACRGLDGTCSTFLRFVWNGTPCGNNKVRRN